MATQARIPMRVLGNFAGISVPALWFPEAAGAVFKKGAPVFLSGGYLTECGADPALIVGIASRDGQNGATNGAKSQLVHLAHPNTMFLGYIDLSAAEGTGTFAATDLGKSYGIAKNAATGYWYVDKTETVNMRVRILDLWDGIEGGVGVAVGDVMAPVVFQIGLAYCQALVAS